MDTIMAKEITAKENEYNTTTKRTENLYQMKYHLMPPVGWLNDPNGLCQFHGEYHVFFQYAPFYPVRNLKAWGHYVSDNLTDWKYINAPILPDTPWDKDGAYSGCALIENDTMHLFYTGNTKEPGKLDYVNANRGANTIYLTSDDGRHFSEKKLLMTNEDYPSDYTRHVRDPKVWKENGKYYMVQGGRKQGDHGAVIVFESTNLTDWNVCNEVTTKESFGYMWECPDYFPIGDIQILSCCPQGVPSQGDRYQNQYQAGYFPMTGDIRGSYELGEFQEWDMGFDFYAPQSFEDQKGRRIMIGWAGVPDAAYNNMEEKDGWIHCLTLPRELIYQKNKIFSYPVEEIKSLRKELLDIDQMGDLRSYELYLTFFSSDCSPEDTAKKDLDCDMSPLRTSSHPDEAFSFELTIADGVQLLYQTKELSLILDEKAGAGRTLRKQKLEQLNELSVFVDHSIAEIYVNHGEYVFTTRFYSDKIKPEIRNMKSVKECRIWRI